MSVLCIHLTVIGDDAHQRVAEMLRQKGEVARVNVKFTFSDNTAQYIIPRTLVSQEEEEILREIGLFQLVDR